MSNNSNINSIEVKKANIRHHNIEALFFEQAHPEGSSIYERYKVMNNISFIIHNSDNQNLCIDVGCGTGFLTSYEVLLYKNVVAIDISFGMIKIIKKRLRNFNSLCLMVCDADYLPFKKRVADLVSISSVLHHMPRPFILLNEVSRVLKQGGFLYITREPNFHRYRRFFGFFDEIIVKKIVTIFTRARASKLPERYLLFKELEYSKVDVHYPTGFHLGELASVLNYKLFDVVSIYSYHWIYPHANIGFWQQILTMINFLLEKIPITNKLGRYVCVIARKT